MKAFNLKEYLKLKEQGKEPKLRLRNGKPARIICIDLLGPTRHVVAAVLEGTGLESIRTYRDDGCQTAEGTTSLDLFFDDIKEEPKYRPYKNAEECFKDVLKHGGWIKNARGQYVLIGGVTDTDIVSFNNYSRQFKIATDVWRWADDNSPLGIKED